MLCIIDRGRRTCKAFSGVSGIGIGGADGTGIGGTDGTGIGSSNRTGTGRSNRTGIGGADGTGIGAIRARVTFEGGLHIKHTLLPL